MVLVVAVYIGLVMVVHRSNISWSSSNSSSSIRKYTTTIVNVGWTWNKS